MNLSTSNKICEHIQHLVVKAAELTIDERGFWGLGHINIHPDLQSFTLTAQEKYHVQILSAAKKINEGWQNINNEDEPENEPYYGTDWTAICSMHGALSDLFLKYKLESNFEFDIENEENNYFVLTNKNKLKIHYVHHDFRSINVLKDSELDELYEQITKLTLFSFMSR